MEFKSNLEKLSCRLIFFRSPPSCISYMTRDCSLDYKENTSSEHVVYKNFFVCFCFDIQSNICTQHVLNLYFSCNSMNNLSLYCGLTDSRMRAFDTDLLTCKFQIF